MSKNSLKMAFVTVELTELQFDKKMVIFTLFH